MMKLEYDPSELWELTGELDNTLESLCDGEDSDDYTDHAIDLLIQEIVKLKYGGKRVLANVI
jgi:hypothetical protein